jgi:hypothetical protein
VPQAIGDIEHAANWPARRVSFEAFLSDFRSTSIN